MKQLISWLMIGLCLATSSLGQTRRVTPTIRQIDFKNFTYPVTDDEGKPYSERLRHGKSSDDATRVAYLAYGDLTGDRQEEAVVILLYSAIGGTGYSTEGFIYTMQGGRAVLLTKFEGGGRENGIVGARVKNRVLIVDRAELVGNDPSCCPVHYRSVSYRWNGNSLVKAGRSSIRRIPSRRK